MERISSRSLIPPFLVVLVFSACAAAQDSQSSPIVTWEPMPHPQAFPAVILATSGVSAKPGNSQALCDPRSSFRIRVKSSTPATHVHVEVMVDGFFAGVSSCDATLENAGEQYIVAPTPRWDTRRLAANDQPYPATVVFGVKANGVDLGQQTGRLQIRAVNDVPYKVTDAEGHMTDHSDLFAAFVNENSPVVDQLLHEALQWHAVGQFYGYNQGRASAEQVRMQVFAIWNALQHRHVKYSSITRASGFSENVRSQSVRFVDQTVRLSEANCVDGSVLFASVLYKIGIYPILVLLPGHMFLGYHLDQRHVDFFGNLEFLETTMIAAGPPVQDRPFKNPAAAVETPSYKEFIAAVRKGDERFQSEVLPKLREKSPGYIAISVDKARQIGINPIPH
jgi:hypothetical protein